MFRHARVLVIDDEAANIEVLRRILAGAGFTRIVSTTDPREAAALYVSHRPDLILLDLHMPQMSGLTVLDRLNAIAGDTYLPILTMTGDLTPEAQQDALARGAKDFVTRPFHADEVILRIRTLLETRFLYFQVQSQNQILEVELRDRTRQLAAAVDEIVTRLRREEARAARSSPAKPKAARILIVDDEPANVEALRLVVTRAGFTNVESTTEPREAAARSAELRPDLVLLALHMAEMSGLDVLDRLAAVARETRPLILMTAGDVTPEVRRDALARGAQDVIGLRSVFGTLAPGERPRGGMEGRQ